MSSRAAAGGCSVEVSLAVENQGSEKRISAVHIAGEGVEHGLVPASAAVRRKFEHGSISQTPNFGRPIEVARPVRGETGIRLAAVAGACEGVEETLSLGLCWASGNQQKAESTASVRARRRTAAASLGEPTLDPTWEMFKPPVVTLFVPGKSMALSLNSPLRCVGSGCRPSIRSAFGRGSGELSGDPTLQERRYPPPSRAF